jgi:glucose/arabinose dehydrogenase
VAVLFLATTPPTAAADAEDFEDLPILTGLRQPTDVVWAPDGRIFVAEKAGRVRVATVDGRLRPVPLIDLSDHVNSYYDRGLLGIALSPQFATDGWMYLAYTAEHDPSASNGPKQGRLTRITVEPDSTVADAEDPETILIDDLPFGDIVHNAGTVRAADDGTLWLSVGDGNPSGILDSPLLFAPGDPDSGAGKLLHVDGEGRGLPDHPFCPQETDLDRMCTKVHAKGFRNPFRFSLLPGGGVVVADVGWNLAEELNLVEAGHDYGWPCFEGDSQTPSYRDLPACLDATAAHGSQPSWPLYSYGPAGGRSILSGPVLNGTAPYPDAYDGRMVYADAVSGFVNAMHVEQPGLAHLPLAEGLDVPVDLELTPDGEVAYVSFTEGSVRRIQYAPGNKTPIASARATPTSGPTPLEVEFTAAGTHDPDDDPLTYSWDFGDGTPSADGIEVTHVYEQAQTQIARVTVSDPAGATSSADVLVSPGDEPPVLEIDAPADGARFRVGETVALEATAVDAQDGPLTAAAISWEVTLHHDEHIHPFIAPSGGLASVETTASHDADSFYEITATATDSASLTTSRTVEIWPETAELTISSDPPGAAVSYAGEALTAPLTRPAAVGFSAAVSAAPEMISGGRLYRFSSWSHGAERLHELTIPEAPLEIVARYGPVSADVPWTPDPVAPLQVPPVFSPQLRSPARVQLGLDRRRGKVRTLAGAARGVRTLEIALRTYRHGGKCRSWSPASGRLAGPRSCGRSRWITARLRGAGSSRRWRAALGGELPPGRYVVLVRGYTTSRRAFRRWEDGRSKGSLIVSRRR